MSLKVEHNNLEEFEKAVNTPEETAKIAAAFAKEEQEFKEKQKNEIPTDTGIIQDIVKQIRNAKSDEEAKQILIDNAVSLYHTETIASLVYFSSIEGPCPIYRDEDEVKGFDDVLTTGNAELEKDPFEGLTEEQIGELLNKEIRFHNNQIYVVFVEKNGNAFILDKEGNKVYWEDIKKLDSKEISEQLPKESWGASYEEFIQMYNESNGFNVKEPENNIKPVSNDFYEFMIRASKGYSETMRKQNESGVARTRNKEQETNSDNK